MAYDRSLATLSSLQPAPAGAVDPRIANTLNSAGSGTLTPEQLAYLTAKQAGVNVGQSAPIGSSGQRIGTIDPYTAAAMQRAQTLGISMPAGPTQQTAPVPGGNTGQATLAPGAAQAIGNPNQGIQNGAVPGAQQGLPQAGGPTQQVTPQQAAMVAEFMRQRALTQAQQRQAAVQGMVDSRGVFAGQQQGTTMPPPAMPPPPQRRGPPVGPVVPNPYGPR